MKEIIMMSGKYLRNPLTVVDMTLPDQPLVYVNPSFEKITQYHFEEVAGKNCRFLQGEGTDPESVAFIKKMLSTNKAFFIDLLNYRKDGSEFWNRLCLLPYVDAKERLFLGMQHEINNPKSLKKDKPVELENAIIRDRINNLFAAMLLSTVHLNKNTDQQDLIGKRLDELATGLSEFIISL
ncbi:MAG: PAS domain-containing protein [Oligoflexales bacterium]